MREVKELQQFRDFPTAGWGWGLGFRAVVFHCLFLSAKDTKCLFAGKLSNEEEIPWCADSPQEN